MGDKMALFINGMALVLKIKYKEGYYARNKKSV